MDERLTSTRNPLASMEHEREPDPIQTREGRVARGIEAQTSRLPSDVWLWAALGSIALSLGLRATARPDASNFVGFWVPTFLLFGVYNKLVKQMGSDRLDQGFGH